MDNSNPAFPVRGVAGYRYASAQDPLTAELPAASILRILHEVKEAGVRAIHWLGGDPLMRKDWYESARCRTGVRAHQQYLDKRDPACGSPHCPAGCPKVTSGGFYQCPPRQPG